MVICVRPGLHFDYLHTQRTESSLVVKRREREAGRMNGDILPRLKYNFMA